MGNQHRKITGYNELDQTTIDLMNEVKAKMKEVNELCTKVRARVNDQMEEALVSAEVNGDSSDNDRLMLAEPEKWLDMAETSFQTAGMFLVRAVAQPTTF